MTKLKLERFVGRRVWENKVINLQQNQANFSGQIETSTIIKDKSPVRAMTYYFSLSSDNKSGKVALLMVFQMMVCTIQMVPHFHLP